MEMDVLKVALSDSIADVIKSVNERMPQAVVAVDDSGAFEGYFSPDDYRQAQSRFCHESFAQFALITFGVYYRLQNLGPMKRRQKCSQNTLLP